MKVFRLDPDYDRFHNFALVDETKATIYDRFDGTPMTAEWKVLDVMAVDTDDELAVLGDHAVLGTVPVLSERAVIALTDVLQANGELLPVLHGKARYFAFNVTTVVNALDPSHAKVKRFSSGRVMAVDEFAFIPERLHRLTIFKIPELRRGFVFVTDAFVDRVRAAQLQGFEFQEIWSYDPTLNAPG